MEETKAQRDVNTVFYLLTKKHETNYTKQQNERDAVYKQVPTQATNHRKTKPLDRNKNTYITHVTPWPNQNNKEHKDN